VTDRQTPYALFIATHPVDVINAQIKIKKRGKKLKKNFANV